MLELLMNKTVSHVQYQCFDTSLLTLDFGNGALGGRQTRDGRVRKGGLPCCALADIVLALTIRGLDGGFKAGELVRLSA